jgi:hypothetical protein
MSGSPDTEQKPALELDYVFKNIAVLTAFITLVTAACTTAVLSGYLNAFLPANATSAFTFLQYTDILQFAFNQLGMMGFISLLVFGLLGAELSKRFQAPLSRITPRTIVAIIIVGLFTWLLASTENLLFFFGIFLVVVVVAAIMALRQRALNLSWFTVFAVIGFVGLFSIGSYIGEREKKKSYDVTLQDGKLENTGLILVLSRGYLFYDRSNEQAFLVPEKEIRRVDQRLPPTEKR